MATGTVKWFNAEQRGMASSPLTKAARICSSTHSAISGEGYQVPRRERKGAVRRCRGRQGPRGPERLARLGLEPTIGVRGREPPHPLFHFDARKSRRRESHARPADLVQPRETPRVHPHRRRRAVARRGGRLRAGALARRPLRGDTSHLRARRGDMATAKRMPSRWRSSTMRPGGRARARRRG